jgi:acetyl esterase/lipase
LSKAAVDPFFIERSILGLAAAAYAGGHDLQDPFISPQFADVRALPSTLIHVGEHEALLDDALILARRMTELGTPVELKVYSGMWHVWQVFGGLFREADQSISELGAFLHARLNP